MYKLSYGRTFNLGNYESERIDLEQTFDDEVPRDEAVAVMKAQVLAMHQVVAKTCDHPNIMTGTQGDFCLRCGELLPSELQDETTHVEKWETYETPQGDPF